MTSDLYSLSFTPSSFLKYLRLLRTSARSSGKQLPLLYDMARQPTKEEAISASPIALLNCRQVLHFAGGGFFFLFPEYLQVSL